ncbi:hypothetical protein OIV83_002503 [Microbotryomycetes sp. JL201]|nr:hypothetical protein OIV83_002503 [Microbotryomycetes sp. JL201]
MGASGSKADVEQSGDETTFFAQKSSPVQFSDTLINHLQTASGPTPDGSVPSSRQQTLDQHIQSRIQSELKRLREQEAQVRQEIERALEKENLDREKGKAGDVAGLSHSASLLKDLEELEARTVKLRQESSKQLESEPWKAVDSGRQTLVECLRNNKQSPLDCQAQVQKFKEAVAGVERAFVANIQ